MSTFERLQNALAGRYLLESEIGEGGSARVFAAQDLRHKRRVAIKILKSEIAEGIAAQRFLREIHVDAALQHPRILPLFDSGDVDGAPFFVMPFVGLTLRALLKRDGPLPVADAVRITAQVADALQYLHDLGFVHRDVKPENILLQNGHVWLADFGIVHALVHATTGHVTQTGTAVGTPAYMSPEQRLGLPDLGARSDQYSLACVLYEMLVGAPPKQFAGAGQSFGSATAHRTPAGSLRPDVPGQLDAVLARALHLEEDRRWPTTRAFADRVLAVTAVTPPGMLAVEDPPRARQRIATMVMVAAAIIATGWWGLRPTLPMLDALSIAVLPLAHEGDTKGKILDGDDCSRLLRDAIGRWTGIHHVDDMHMRDVRARMGRPESLKDAMAMATRLGAGLAVWGTVGPSASASNDSTRAVHLVLYDVSSRTIEQEATGLIDARTDLGAAFQLLADSLLSGTGGAKPTTIVSGSRNFVAVRAYLDGHHALDAFDLAGASIAFRHAIEADPKFGLAFLWLAWTTLWMPEASSDEWGAAASRALAVGSGLTARDSMQARALVNMNEHRYAEACDQFRSLTERDAGDFAAWYGLGECLSGDVTVVSSASSPSGWQFRTSISEAIRAYEKAIDLAPSFTDAMGQRAAQRIARWLFAQTGRYRAGLADDSIRFAAWPSLSSDTLAFIPFPEQAVFAESAGTRDASYQQALQRNREHVLAIVNHWVALDSANVLALEAVALAREANDELVTLRRTEAGPRLTGVAALGRARMLARDDNAIRLAVTDIRFHIKTDRYADARRLADSLLHSVSPDGTSASVASMMQSVAMLTGAVDDALMWGRRSTNFQYRDLLHPSESISPSLSAAASDAATFAAFRAPVDSIRAALVRTERAAADEAQPRQDMVRQVFIDLPALYAWPLSGLVTTSLSRNSTGNRWLAIQFAFSRGDTASARAQLVQADSSGIRGGASEMAFEIVALHARMFLALHDTANAVRVVSSAIDQLRLSGDQLMGRPTATAAFVQLLITRAALAEALRDTAEARTWGTRAWTLWGDASSMIGDQMSPIQRWRGIPLSRGVQ